MRIRSPYILIPFLHCRVPFFPRIFLGEKITQSSHILRSCNFRNCSECSADSGRGVFAVMPKLKLFSKKFSCSEITLLFSNTVRACHMLSPRCVETVPVQVIGWSVLRNISNPGDGTIYRSFQLNVLLDSC